MIRRLTLFVMFPLMIFALSLSLFGVKHIGYGEEYYSFFKSIGVLYNGWRLDIPDIPRINIFNDINFDDTGLILGVLIKIARAFFGFINAIIVVVNTIIKFVNYFINLIQFFLTFVWRIKDFVNSFITEIVFI